MPKTMKDKMYLFLKAIAPSDIPESEFNDYEFSQEEIIKVCNSALYCLHKQQDDFFQ
jgi:hypothetical protein